MITIKSEKEISIMREGGVILAKIIKELEREAQPGITTGYLNKVAQDLVFKYGGEPSFLGHDNFPAVVCTSVNDEVVHWPPSGRVLKAGDIIVLDIGVKYKGFHTDMATTFAVGGKADSKAMELINATEEALAEGIKAAKVGNSFSDIGRVVQKYVEGQGFNVVRDLCGHGIGTSLHEDPEILNYYDGRKREKIKKGMVFCIEPITTMGRPEIRRDKETGGYRTKDGSLSAHFEHTIAITDKGTEILTK